MGTRDPEQLPLWIAASDLPVSPGLRVNGLECAWQAKYFLTLGDRQWPQIDRSVRTVLQKHPRLARYVICLLMDLPDARVAGQESTLAKWDAHIEKWEGWASERGRDSGEHACPFACSPPVGGLEGGGEDGRKNRPDQA